VLDTHRLQDLIHFSPRSLEVGVRDTLEVRAHQQPALEPDPLGVASTPLLLTPE
jgi:hypothetical protein